MKKFEKEWQKFKQLSKLSANHKKGTVLVKAHGRFTADPMECDTREEAVAGGKQCVSKIQALAKKVISDMDEIGHICEEWLIFNHAHIRDEDPLPDEWQQQMKRMYAPKEEVELSPPPQQTSRFEAMASPIEVERVPIYAGFQSARSSSESEEVEQALPTDRPALHSEVLLSHLENIPESARSESEFTEDIPQSFIRPPPPPNVPRLEIPPHRVVPILKSARGRSVKRERDTDPKPGEDN